MNQIYPDEGLVRMLERLITDDVRYHLFTNNVTIDRDTVLADLTEQTGGTGYATVDVELADWTLSGVTSHVGSLMAPPISFTPAGGDWTLYGYYVTDVAGSELLWAANFDGAPITQLDGDPLLITPVVGDLSKYAS